MDDELTPRECFQCGTELSPAPDREVPKEQTEHCDGQLHGEMEWTECGKARAHDPHDPVIAAWMELHFICTNPECQHDNVEVDA
jgi:hypothetical protein